ncbi:MAG: GH151 [uncultured Thermomicrobiales bacterium]|uniref:GH151 n=1 Tax=uncultured Thermomicrobiales bacterium TaxID=1645740 RepID=A0A6J4UDQ7_9BACT|nr:MAG: GH151 [uncultured Thermomicrobiales bacterium]
MAAPSRLRMRQVHLDFHTPGEIPDVGKAFDAARFAETVRAAHVDSMTVFSRCHHGYSYHPTDVGTMHPGLGFDLLGAQIEALHGVGVRAPIYLTVGWDELMADTHPEWLQLRADGRICRSRPDDLSSWRFLDFASPYVDYVLACTEEVLDRYGPVDGIFFDIIRQGDDGNGSVWRRRRLREEGVDPRDPVALRDFETRIERGFMERASALVRGRTPEATIFYNSRLRPDRDPALGSRAELPFYSHVEIESLPGGGWGYNHYPLFAAYFQTLPWPILGMTGIFHTHWGDFGSIKTEPALRYECARMLASGAACSVGDHLHPRGALDAATYERLGAVFGGVAAVEPWCVGAEPVPEVGVLLAETGPRFATVGRESDEGALRMLLELHRPFRFLDRDADLAPYAVVIAPDDVPFDEAYAAKIGEYLDGGGSLLLTHRAGLSPEGDRFAPALAAALGVEYAGEAPETPDFLVAGPELGEALAGYHQVLYDRGSAVRATGAETLARVGVPYFTRSPEHFFGHRQAAFDHATDLPAVTQRGRVIYCHSPLFGAYRQHAVPAYRDLIGALLDRLVPDPALQTPGLPTTAEVALLRQPDEGRTVLHLIHAVPQRRGPVIDVVEDVLPLADVRVGVRLPRPAATVTLAPGGEPLAHEERDGVTWVSVPRVAEHQVVVFAE